MTHLQPRTDLFLEGMGSRLAPRVIVHARTDPASSGNAHQISGQMKAVKAGSRSLSLLQGWRAMFHTAIR
jgi:hypothetical protein